MGIWIRSQDKEKLININEHFSIEYTDVGMDKTQLKSIKYAIWGDNVKLGIYSSKAKALKVLDDIEEHITKNEAGIYNSKFGVFQMPQDETEE